MSQTILLVSYYTPSSNFDVPQYVFDQMEDSIHAQQRSVALVGVCVAQVSTKGPTKVSDE